MPETRQIILILPAYNPGDAITNEVEKAYNATTAKLVLEAKQHRANTLPLRLMSHDQLDQFPAAFGNRLGELRVIITIGEPDFLLGKQMGGPGLSTLSNALKSEELLGEHAIGVPRIAIFSHSVFPEMRKYLESKRREGTTFSEVSYAQYDAVERLRSHLTSIFDGIRSAGVEAPEPIPPQGAGPNFGIGDNFAIAGVATSLSGNDDRRIGQLLGLVRDCAGDLLAHSQALSNQHPALLRHITRYRDFISVLPAEIQWGAVWGAGVRLETAAAAYERRLYDRMAPALEDEPLSALQALRNLHGPLILATGEGRELQEQADRLQMTREQQDVVQRASNSLSEELRRHDEIIDPQAAAVVAEAAEMVGAEPYPERGTIFGLATVKNVTIVLFSAALASLPNWFLPGAVGKPISDSIWDVFKRSRGFAKAATELGEDVEKAATELRASAAFHSAGSKVVIEQLAPFRAFVQLNHLPLTEIAEATSQLRWMLPYIRYIRGNSGD